MSLLCAIRDAARIINAGGFNTELVFEKNGVQYKIQGLTFVTHLAIDGEGRQVNSKQAHITFVENDLTKINAQTRNETTNDVNMKVFTVSFTDMSKKCKSYKIRDNWSDDTLGIISLQLEKLSK